MKTPLENLERSIKTIGIIAVTMIATALTMFGILLSNPKIVVGSAKEYFERECVEYFEVVKSDTTKVNAPLLLVPISRDEYIMLNTTKRKFASRIKENCK